MSIQLFVAIIYYHYETFLVYFLAEGIRRVIAKCTVLEMFSPLERYPFTLRFNNFIILVCRPSFNLERFVILYSTPVHYLDARTGLIMIKYIELMRGSSPPHPSISRLGSAHAAAYSHVGFTESRLKS